MKKGFIILAIVVALLLATVITAYAATTTQSVCVSYGGAMKHCVKMTYEWDGGNVRVVKKAHTTTNLLSGWHYHNTGFSYLPTGWTSGRILTLHTFYLHNDKHQTIFTAHCEQDADAIGGKLYVTKFCSAY